MMNVAFGREFQLHRCLLDRFRIGQKLMLANRGLILCNHFYVNVNPWFFLFICFFNRQMWIDDVLMILSYWCTGATSMGTLFFWSKFHFSRWIWHGCGFFKLLYVYHLEVFTL